MKKYIILSALCLFLEFQNFGQSITLSPGSVSINKLGNGFVHESMDGLRKVGTNVSGATFGQFETKSNDPLNFSASPDIALVLATNGNFAVGGNFTPEAKLHVNGWTKLGIDAPAIATLLYEGVTASTQNGYTVFNHGLDASKILSITLTIDKGGFFVSENYKTYNGYQAGVSFENTYIYIWTSPTNSENILNKPVKAFVVYEQ